MIRPIDIFTRVQFRPMTDSDAQAFAGIEYDGFIAELGARTIVMDHGPGGMHVEVYDEDGDVINRWDFAVSDMEGTV